MKIYSGPAFELGGSPIRVEFGRTHYESALDRWMGDTSMPLHHIHHHSFDAFGWGYGGSGPLDTARSILFDHFDLGPPAHGKASPDDNPEIVKMIDDLYKDFCHEVIANIPQKEPFYLTTFDINEWLFNQERYRKGLVDNIMQMVLKRAGV